MPSPASASEFAWSVGGRQGSTRLQRPGHQGVCAKQAKQMLAVVDTVFEPAPASAQAPRRTWSCSLPRSRPTFSMSVHVQSRGRASVQSAGARGKRPNPVFQAATHSTTPGSVRGATTPGATVPEHTYLPLAAPPMRCQQAWRPPAPSGGWPPRQQSKGPCRGIYLYEVMP